MKNLKLWNNFYAKKNFIPEFPDKCVQDFYKYHLIKKKKIKIIDIGCGSGSNLFFLKKKGLDVYGVDNSSKAINFILKKNRSLKKKLFRCSFTNLPFKNECFDAAISIGVFYYEDIDGIKNGIDELYRVLKKNGLARIYLISNKDKKYNKDFKKVSEGWEKNMKLVFLNMSQITKLFCNFNKLIIGEERFNYMSNDKFNSYWVITVKK
ncbi:class I SAM-dependent methyltransferase [Candidatus Pelagibacter sp.]|nr:class I SAM-dependent methyltransferase [Candidatus Pelagibacter sp.]